MEPRPQDLLGDLVGGVVCGRYRGPRSADPSASRAVQDGRIADIGDELEGAAERVIDGGGLHLLPGVIDPHTHPGLVAPLERRLPLESRGGGGGASRL